MATNVPLFIRLKTQNRDINNEITTVDRTNKKAKQPEYKTDILF